MNNKPWISVESSSLERLKYNPNTLELLVEFKGGAQYLYQRLSKEAFLTLITADSIGSVFHNLIKVNPGRYPYEKVTETFA